MYTCKAIDEFRANLDGGVNPVLVKKGTVFTYDGNFMEVMGSDGVVKKGSVPMLKSLLNEWYVELEESKPVVTAQDTPPEAPLVESVPKAAPQPVKPEIAHAKEVVDSSAVGSDNLGELIEKYEIKSGLRDRPSPTIIDDDATIVRQVTKTAGESKTRNTSGVQLEDSEVGKRTIVSHEERLVKITQYAPNPTVDPSEPRKQRAIVRDSEGVVVKKTSEKAIFRNEIHQNKIVEKSEVSVEEGVVKEASYEKNKPTDIGSTTQAQIASKQAAEKRATENIAKRTKQVSGDQDGIVVGKVRKDKGVEVTGDGFVSKLSVGVNEERMGEVEFGNNSEGDIDGIIGGDAVVSGGGMINASDASDEGTIVSSSSKNDDVDIGDIIEGI